MRFAVKVVTFSSASNLSYDVLKQMLCDKYSELTVLNDCKMK